MQGVHIDSVDRRILDLLQSQPGINAAAIGEKIGLSQSAVWRRMQGLREQGIIREQPVKIDREKVGLNTMVFAHVKLTSHGRSNLAEFSEAVQEFPEVLDCYVMLGNVDFLLRIVTEDIKAYEQFFFEKLSQLPGIQEVNSSIVLISAANARLQSGMSVMHATLYAARRRVIPILITSLTTVAGLFSLATGLGGKSLIWGPVATAIVWGLGFSTILTLIVIPLLYQFFMTGRKKAQDIVTEPRFDQ